MQGEIVKSLTGLKKNGKWIALQLHPAVGSSTISRDGNRLFINEGRDGKWDGVSESFYDEMVAEFDSRR